MEYFECSITGKKEPLSHPHYKFNGLIMSEEGVEQVVEAWIHKQVQFGKGDYPILLHYLIERCTKKKRRSTYLPSKVREYILRKYKNKCCFCGSTDRLEIDHIKPVSKGGLSDVINLQVLCKQCNIKKSNKIL